MNKYFNIRTFPKFFILLLLIGLSMQTLFAQEMRFVAQVNSNTIGIEDHLVITFSLENFPSGDLSNLDVKFPGFQVLAGPMVSNSRNISIINGKREVSETNSYTYEARPTALGAFTIPPAKVVLNGKTYTSNPVKVQVVEGSLRPQRQASPQRQFRDPFEEFWEEMQRDMEEMFGAPRMMQPQRQQIDYYDFTEDKIPQNIFLKIEADKKEVYEGEPLKIEYKLYTRLNMNMAITELPDLNGFWTEDFKLPDRPTPTIEKVNGRDYQVYTLKKSVLYPQITGNLVLDEAVVEGQLEIIDIFQDQFGRTMASTKTVDKSLKSQAVNIHVKALPKLPHEDALHQGGVGKLKRTIELDQAELGINDPAILRIVYEGEGNLPMIAPPKLKMSNELSYTDAQKHKQYHLGQRGFEGSQVLEYLIYADQGGDYNITIPDDYVFDVTTGQYHLLEGQEFTISFEGESAIEDVEELALNQYLNTNKKYKNWLPGYKWSVILSALLALLSYLLWHEKYRHQLIALVPKKVGKSAQDEAWERLGLAEKYLKEEQPQAFHEAILNALLLFISDKLNIPMASLNKDTYQQALLEKDIPHTHWEKMEAVIAESEMFLYSPVKDTNAMAQQMKAAQEAMVILQNYLKDK